MHGGTHRITRRICTETKNAIPSGQRYIVPPIYLKNFCKGEDRKCFLYPNALLTFFLLVNCYKVLHFERPPAVGLNVVVSDRLTAIRSARPFGCRRRLVPSTAAMCRPLSRRRTAPRRPASASSYGRAATPSKDTRRRLCPSSGTGATPDA